MNKMPLELGSGGRLMREFISGPILDNLGNRFLNELSDSALLPSGLALTTDSYVVHPLFFPGGDIGKLAIYGTVNDLIAAGAEPRYMSLAFIIEEGLDEAVIGRVLRSVRSAADRAGVLVVTGDTKLVRQGQADKLFINTSGVGKVIARPALKAIRPGDKIIVTGEPGDHSLAVMSARGEFPIRTAARSDTAPLLFLLNLWRTGALWMRDLTRGGLATILCELAERLPYPVLIEEELIPFSRSVQAAADILGIDPLFLASEGKAVVVAPGGKAENMVKAIRRSELGRKAAVIGQIGRSQGRPGELLLKTSAGGLRLLEPLTTELLPRIC